MPELDTEQEAAARSPRYRAQSLSLLGIALLVYAADQLSKNWVVANLPEQRSVAVLGDVLQWYFVRNPGAAFSMASGATWLFTVLAAVVVGAIIWQIRHLGSRTWAIFFALLLGGVLGNLTDRLTRDPGFPVGHVIDFISTPWLIPAIYNIADIAIVSAMCLFVLITLLGLPIDGSPRERSKRSGSDDTSSDSRDSDSSDDEGGDDSQTLDADGGDHPESEQRRPE